MTKVYIQYNACTVQTAIAINGAWVQQPSLLAGFSGQRLQDWAPRLISTLLQQCNDYQFDMEFYGTTQDYNDLMQAIVPFLNNGQVQAQVAFQPWVEVEQAIAMEAEKKAEYLNRIEGIRLAEVSDLEREIQSNQYSNTMKSELMLALERRKLALQREDLAERTSGMDTMDRLGLETLLTEILGLGYDRSLTEEYRLSVTAKRDEVEQEELKTLAGDLESKEIEDLQKLRETLAAGNYQQRFVAGYYTAIASKIEALHIRNMDQYCAIVPTETRDNVQIIRNKIDAEDCLPALKIKYYQLIDKRLEELDYQALSELTEGVEDKDLEALQKLYTEIESGSYNVKFVREFLMKVRLVMDRKTLEQVDKLAENIETMSKEEAVVLREKLAGLGYAKRFTDTAYRRIEDRIYVLDLQELMAMGNDYDRMSLEDINNLRLEISRKDVTPRAMGVYTAKLAERERVAGLSLVSQHAAYAMQGMNQMGLAEAGLVIPLYSAQYDALLEDHFNHMGMRNFYDIPFLFLADCPGFALSRTQVFYKTAEGFGSAPITELRQMATEKKMFSEILVLTLSNGMEIRNVGSVSKKSSGDLMNYLAILVNNVGNQQMMSQYPVYEQHVEPLTDASLVAPQYEQGITFELLAGILSRDTAPYNEKNLKVYGGADYDNACTKAMTNLNVWANERIACYYEKSFLGMTKDCFAFTDQAVYVKNATVGVTRIGYEDIFNLTAVGSQMNLLLRSNVMVQADLAASTEAATAGLVAALREYAQGAQSLEKRAAQAQPTAPVPPVVPVPPVAPAPQETPAQPTFCRQCGAKLLPGAAFCTGCGSRIS